MRRVMPALTLVGMIVAAVCGCSAAAPTGSAAARVGSAAARAGSAAPGHPRPPVSYYLALGDSLAQGVQPTASGPSVRTGHGYADLLYAALRRRRPGLRLVKLGCPGETTVTMIHGGICRYPGGSQLAAAVRFLHAHRGRVSLVTLDIGANDADWCVSTPSLGKLVSCASSSIPRATTDLATILARLRQADPSGRIIGMNYYMPALAEWRRGLAGEMVARASELALDGYNALLTRVYKNYGVRVADVAGAFHTADFAPQVTVPGLGRLPRNVAAVCQWTWECASPPRGPNVHPNQAGYEAITRAFVQAGA